MIIFAWSPCKLSERSRINVLQLSIQTKSLDGIYASFDEGYVFQFNSETEASIYRPDGIYIVLIKRKCIAVELRYGLPIYLVIAQWYSAKLYTKLIK